MRKIYTLFLVALTCCLIVRAQNTDTRFQFVRGDGSVIESGSVITFSNVEETAFGDKQIKPDIYLQNTSGSNIPMAVIGNITNLPSGRMQFCAFGYCNSYSTTGEQEKTGLLSGWAKDDLQLEWVPQGKYDSSTGEYDYSEVEGTTASIKIDTEVRNTGNNNGVGSRVVGVGPSITVNFVFPSTNGIRQTKVSILKESIRYNIRGQNLSRPEKGLNIFKTSDGRIIKQIVK